MPAFHPSCFVKATVSIRTASPRGWVLYDGDCQFCTGTVRRFASLLRRARFTPEPLQAPWVSERLGLQTGRIPDEMMVLTTDGKVFGGADGIIYLLRWIWWAWPLFVVAQIPGMHGLLRAGYRQVARNRHCLSGACRIPRQRHRGTAAFYELP